MWLGPMRVRWNARRQLEHRQAAEGGFRRQVSSPENSISRRLQSEKVDLMVTDARRQNGPVNDLSGTSSVLSPGLIDPKGSSVTSPRARRAAATICPGCG